MLRRGETERKGGWRKKEREARGIDVPETDGKAEDAVEREKEYEEEEDVPRRRGGLLALSLCFSKLRTPF